MLAVCNVITNVAYVSIDEGGWLARQTSRAASAVARARRRGGSVTAIEKADGSYVVAGYGSMPGPHVVVLQCSMGRDRGGRSSGKGDAPLHPTFNLGCPHRGSDCGSSANHGLRRGQNVRSVA